MTGLDLPNLGLPPNCYSDFFLVGLVMDYGCYKVMFLKEV